MSKLAQSVQRAVDGLEMEPEQTNGEGAMRTAEQKAKHAAKERARRAAKKKAKRSAAPAGPERGVRLTGLALGPRGVHASARNRYVNIEFEGGLVVRLFPAGFPAVAVQSVTGELVAWLGGRLNQ